MNIKKYKTIDLKMGNYCLKHKTFIEDELRYKCKRFVKYGCINTFLDYENCLCKHYSYRITNNVKSL